MSNEGRTEIFEQKNPAPSEVILGRNKGHKVVSGGKLEEKKYQKGGGGKKELRSPKREGGEVEKSIRL